MAASLSDQRRTPVGALAAGAKLDRYEILAKLASGGMATVYVARVQGVAGFERLVAIKVLHANLAHEDEFISMFLDEARLAASIRHSNVVPTIDVSDAKEAGCGYFIVMEYIEGDHLGGLLAAAHKAGERVPVPVSLRIVADALAGLGAAHALCDDTGKSLQLVHRDVSPHNIMVGRDGVVRLTDFGVAKAEDRLTHTRDGQVKGKLAYMAPEQAMGIATDVRSDLFSMGVILWESITGRRLFRAETTTATLHKLLHAEIPKPSSIDASLAPLDALLTKALSRNAAERFGSAEAFAQAIEDVAPQLGGVASLRAVARTVKQHAAVKLAREKALVDDALRALRPNESLADSLELMQEPSSPSVTEISAASVSLSASKVSGVFSHDTLPGAPRTGSRRTVTGETSSAVLPEVNRAPAAREAARSVELRFAHAEKARVAPRRTENALLVIAAIVIALATFYVTVTRPWASAARAPSVAPASLNAAQAEPTEAPLGVEPTRTTSTGSTAVVPLVSTVPAKGSAPAPSIRSSDVRSEPGQRPQSSAPAPRSSRRARRDAGARTESVGAPSDVIPNPYHVNSQR